MFEKRTSLILLTVVWFCALLVVGKLFAEAGVSFARKDFDVEGSPRAIVVGDFNGDAVQDLAVASSGPTVTAPGTVSILLGHGDGTFEYAQILPLSGGPQSIAIGDFDGDAVQDLAVAHYAQVQNGVSILLGLGDGLFEPAAYVPIRGFSTAVAVADFNEDGYLDLALANQGSEPGTAVILLGNGDGTFQAAQYFSAGSLPRSVAVGDLNGDELLDLAVGNSSLGASSISVLLGNGDGTFQSYKNITLPGSAWFLIIEDFNGDKALDVAVANYGLRSASVLLGEGDGTFQPVQNFRVEPFPRSITAGDFNSDKVLDLAIAAEGTAPNSGAVSVLLGNGDGTFGPTQNLEVGSYPQSIAVGDFNGDNVPDLAVGNVGSGTVSILTNDGHRP